MFFMMTTTNTATKLETLKTLRAKVRGKVRETGITLTATYRTRDTARHVLAMARELGDSTADLRVGSARRRSYTCPTTGKRWTDGAKWSDITVELSIGIVADQYLAGRINLRKAIELGLEAELAA